MSLVDSITEQLERGTGKVASKLADPAWVDKAVERGRAELNRIPGTSARTFAGWGLDELERHRETLGETTQAGFVAVVARLQLGQHDEARDEWLRSRATVQERIAERLGAQQKELDELDAEAAKWERIKRVGLEVLDAAGHVAIPILLSTLAAAV